MSNNDYCYDSQLGEMSSSLFKLTEQLDTIIWLVGDLIEKVDKQLDDEEKCSCGKSLKKCMEDNGMNKEVE